MNILASAVILLVGIGMVAQGDEAPSLGLAERRAIKQYQEKTYPDLKKKINEAAAFELPVDVNWESIAHPGEADRYSENDYWTNIFFEPLIESLKSLASDDLGKKALHDKLKKVVIHCTSEAPASNYEAGLKFDGGTLTINWQPYSNAQDLQERTKTLTKFLEAKL